jgi:hypothetical protein
MLMFNRNVDFNMTVVQKTEITTIKKGALPICSRKLLFQLDVIHVTTHRRMITCNLHYIFGYNSLL